MKDWLDFIRGVVRPFTTMFLVVAMIFFVVVGATIPDRFWDLVFMVVAFWFGQRTKSTPT